MRRRKFGGRGRRRGSSGRRKSRRINSYRMSRGGIRL